MRLLFKRLSKAIALIALFFGFLFYLPRAAYSACFTLNSGDYTISATCTIAADSIEGSDISFGKARSFNGSSDYIQTASGYNFTSEAFTIETWVNPSNIANSPVLFSNGAYQVGGYYMHLNSNGSVTFRTNQAAATQDSSTAAGTFTTGTWQHLAIVRNGSSVRIYKNGVDVTSSAGTHVNPTSTAQLFTLGTYGPSPSGWYYTGSIDDVRVYNYARSAAQITEDMNNKTITGTSPVGWWKLNETTGSSAADSGTGGNAGTATGTTIVAGRSENPSKLTVNAAITMNSGVSGTTTLIAGSIELGSGGSIAIGSTNAAIKVGNGVWLTDSDQDGWAASFTLYDTETSARTRLGAILSTSAADCNDANAAVTAGSTWYQDFDVDTYGNPSVTTSSCSQPGGYVSNNTDCYDSNANAKPGQTTCYTVHRGDTSFDYDCSGAGGACNSCSTGYNTTASLAWRQCSGGACYTDPYNTFFTGYSCTGSTSTCGAGGYTCTGSKASGCSSPCTLSSYYNTGQSGCTVSCR